MGGKDARSGEDLGKGRTAPTWPRANYFPAIPPMPGSSTTVDFLQSRPVSCQFQAGRRATTFLLLYRVVGATFPVGRVLGERLFPVMCASYLVLAHSSLYAASILLSILYRS